MQTLVNVTLPEMGESVSEGSIVEWRKHVGDWVDEGETLVDITTDKVDVEVPSLASGVITALHGDEGATIPVGAVLAEIDTTAAKPEGAATAASADAPAAANASATDAPAAGTPAGNAPAAATLTEATLTTPSSYGAAGSRLPAGRAQRRPATARRPARPRASSRTTPGGWSSGSTSTPPS